MIKSQTPSDSLLRNQAHNIICDTIDRRSITEIEFMQLQERIAAALRVAHQSASPVPTEEQARRQRQKKAKVELTFAAAIHKREYQPF